MVNYFKTLLISFSWNIWHWRKKLSKLQLNPLLQVHCFFQAANLNRISKKYQYQNLRYLHSQVQFPKSSFNHTKCPFSFSFYVSTFGVAFFASRNSNIFFESLFHLFNQWRVEQNNLLYNSTFAKDIRQLMAICTIMQC